MPIAIVLLTINNQLYCREASIPSGHSEYHQGCALFSCVAVPQWCTLWITLWSAHDKSHYICAAPIYHDQRVHATYDYRFLIMSCHHCASWQPTNTPYHNKGSVYHRGMTSVTRIAHYFLHGGVYCKPDHNDAPHYKDTRGQSKYTFTKAHYFP